MVLSRAVARAGGLAAGFAADRVFGDPVRGHPVALFGRAAGRLEGRMWRDERRAGVAYTAICVAGPVALGLAAERAGRGRPMLTAAATALATWTALGGASLVAEGRRLGDRLSADDLAGARLALRSLCGRDPDRLEAGELARATVESLAENTSDAVVAPLLWGAVAGIPGLLAYRAVNTLDAMVGYRNARYERFGWASARLDDLANLVPARVSGLLVATVAPAVGGSRTAAWRVLRRDGRRHPSPNAGQCEAAFAGALGVRLGGVNRYGEVVEARAELGDGPRPVIGDIERSAHLSRLVGSAAAVLAIVVALARRPR